MIAVRVGQQVVLRQEIADLLGDHRRAALAAADIDGKAELALVVLLQMQADIVRSGWRRGRARRPVTAILNLRGRKENSGCTDDHWRRISA